MSDNEEPPGQHHGLTREIVGRIVERHARAVQRREEAEPAEAIDDAAFDLGADLGHPSAPRTAVGYDVEGDLGIE